MFKAVMFDLDGTVVDTLDDLRFAMNSMLSHFGYNERSKREIRSFLGNGQKAFVTASLPEYARNEENIARCGEYYGKFYAQNTVRFSRPFDGIPEVLAGLKAAGVYVALVTNKNQAHAEQIIKALFADSLFDVVLGAGKFRRKPDPEAPLYVAKKLGVLPSECAFVGDSDVDIITAKNAGMYSVGVSWGFRERSELCDAGAREIADSADELARILGIRL